MIYEAVIDLSAPRPRLAYLREMSLFATTVQIAANVEIDPDDKERWPEAQPEQTQSREFDEVIEPDPDTPMPVAGSTGSEPDARTRRIGRWLGGR